MAMSLRLPGEFFDRNTGWRSIYLRAQLVEDLKRHFCANDETPVSNVLSWQEQSLWASLNTATVCSTCICETMTVYATGIPTSTYMMDRTKLLVRGGDRNFRSRDQELPIPSL
ncbi:hypothetical protein HNY73_003503 [Argiope bruennichi]|uniref:Uncharacterized protein n=1 Tax=Argiope bruennichi TaxID=94029 RepID=A0A8T0FMV0_ARGBR|nr:hypothetical protein HNY73_003503 [Argiope bruennichi]